MGKKKAKKLFKSYFEADLPFGMEKASDQKQFKLANTQFKKKFDSDPLFRFKTLNKVGKMAKKVSKVHPEYEFNKKIFKDEVKSGHNPPGFTWHHPGIEEVGKKAGKILHLVETSVHEKKHHTGGRSQGGGGDWARRHGK